ncbi:MAG TPA: hypothetical protein VHU15_17830 [Stellaceae bacterium]|jgi:hypothetical protein|nr:hypothetical protein [Stellaceae bacterium]
MPSYRCYFLDESDHISGTEIIDADALTAAVEKARALLRDLPNHRAVEVWQGDERLYAPASPR